MSINPYSFSIVDPDLRWKQIADEVRDRPGALDDALEILDRWEAWGRTHPSAILQWREKIIKAQTSTEYFEEFISYLAEPNVDMEPLKSCSPFTACLELFRS